MVDIYLRPPDEGPYVLALSVPSSDIQRLSVRPLKWLRFVTFAVCGVSGNLSATIDGPAVDYDNITHADIAQAYYYTPQGDYHLVDYNALNDRITSSEQTARRSRFRADVMVRDGSFCVFTGEAGDVCDATHIIPRSKGDEYLSVVYQDRHHLYGPIPALDAINSVENGILLSKTLHAMFGHGKVAFLATPSHALDPVDIPRVETDPMPPSRITLQHLEPPVGRHPMPGYDAYFAGTRKSLPPVILLDYMYGVAAYKRWGARQSMDEVMQRRFSEHYESIPIPPPSPTSSDGNESDDSRDADFESRTPPKGRYHRSDMSPGMLQAMDDIFALSMWLRGTTPKEIAAERQRREAEEELHAQKASQVKVLEWMQSDMCSLSCQANSAPANTKCLTQVNEDPTSAFPSHGMDATSSPQDLENDAHLSIPDADSGFAPDSAQDDDLEAAPARTDG